MTVTEPIMESVPDIIGMIAIALYCEDERVIFKTQFLAHH
jgi:hypothetical protein